MNSPFLSQTQRKNHNALNEINSDSYLNNVAMKYRFEKMKLSTILTKIEPYKQIKASNLFERVKHGRGIYLDRDISLSQKFLHDIKQNRVIRKKVNYDICSIIPNNEIVKTASTPIVVYNDNSSKINRREPLLSLNEKKTNFFRNSSLLKINNDSFDEFVSELNKGNGNSKIISDTNPKAKVISDQTSRANIKEIKIRQRLINKKKYLIKQAKECKKIKPESLIKQPKRKIVTDSDKISNLKVRIPKVEERYLILNTNCAKMKSNLNRELNERSQLKLNNNYIKEQCKNGIELYLDYYLTPLSNNNSSSELTAPVFSKEIRKQLSYCNSTSSVATINSKQYGLSMKSFHQKTMGKLKPNQKESTTDIINMTCLPEKCLSNSAKHQTRSRRDDINNNIKQLKNISDKGFKHILNQREQKTKNRMINISERIENICTKIYRKLDDCQTDFLSKVDSVKSLKKDYINKTQRKVVLLP